MSKKIIVDCGHGEDTLERTGGKGVKVNNKWYEEHHFNAKTGIELKKILEKHGFIVRFSQKPFANEVPLKKRTDEANAWGADLFWSIHANAGSPSANGCCSFYWHTASGAKKLSLLFAEEIRRAGLKTHGSGIHASVPNSWTNLHVVRETKMTAVLTENGFMTNPEDFKRIFLDENYPKKIAVIHAKAICQYFGVTFKEEKVEVQAESKMVYRVRKDWRDADSQIGAYSLLENAKAIVDKNKDHKVFDEKGNMVYEYKEEKCSAEEEVEKLKKEMSRLTQLNRELMEERNKFKKALMDIDKRVEEEL